MMKRKSALTRVLVVLPLRDSKVNFDENRSKISRSEFTDS